MGLKLGRQEKVRRNVSAAIALMVAFTTVASASFANASICDRHPAIQQAILMQLMTSECSSVNKEHLKSLTSLVVSSPISKISSTDLRGLNNLESLLLTSNDVEEISDSAFNDLVKLRELSLGLNRIKKVQRNLLRPLRSLEVLALGANEISEIDRQALEKNVNLKVLDLSNNFVKIWPDDLLKSCNNLEELDLSFSFIPPDLKPDWFYGKSRLKVLGLSHLGLNQLEPELLEVLSEIEALELISNDFNENIFSQIASLKKLKQLNLRNNNITTIRKSDLLLLPSLEVLEIGSGKLQHLEDDLFVGTSIREVRLESAPLSDTNAAAFRGVKVTGLPQDFGISNSREDAAAWD